MRQGSAEANKDVKIRIANCCRLTAEAEKTALKQISLMTPVANNGDDIFILHIVYLNLIHLTVTASFCPLTRT